MKKNAKGFTVVEILIAVAIIGILLVVSVPSFISSINDDRANEDQVTLRELDIATQMIATSSGIEIDEVFAGTFSNSERLNLLASNGSILQIPQPAQKNVDFVWLSISKKWSLKGDGFDPSNMIVNIG